MNELKKKIAHWQDKAVNVKSEKDARVLIEEIKPHLSELTKIFFDENDNDTDTDEIEIEIDWIGEIRECILETIQLYLTFHVNGKLERVHFSLTEECPPIITLIIDGHEYSIDYEEIKSGTNKNNRDDHRECYYKNESIWFEFRDLNPYIELNKVGDLLCASLKIAFPFISVEYTF